MEGQVFGAYSHPCRFQLLAGESLFDRVHNYLFDGTLLFPFYFDNWKTASCNFEINETVNKLLKPQTSCSSILIILIHKFQQYKIKLVQELIESDPYLRMQFYKISQRLIEDPSLLGIHLLFR